MKIIGEMVNPKMWSTTMTNASKTLFLADEDNERVDGERYNPAGWILPLDGTNKAGPIFPDKNSAGKNGRAVYVLAPQPDTTGKRLDDIERAVAALARERHNITELTRMPPNDDVTFWDHALIHATLNHPEFGIAPIDHVVSDAVELANRLTDYRNRVDRTKRA